MRPFIGLTRLSEDSFCDKLGWEKKASHEVPLDNPSSITIRCHHALLQGNTQPIPHLTPGVPIPHNHDEGFDAPPTLERSGSEHRVGRFPSSSLRGEDRDERWSLP